MLRQQELWINPSRTKRKMSTTTSQRKHPLVCIRSVHHRKSEGLPEPRNQCPCQAQARKAQHLDHMNHLRSPGFIYHSSVIHEANLLMQHQCLAYKGSVIKTQMDLTNTRGNNKYPTQTRAHPAVSGRWCWASAQIHPVLPSHSPPLFDNFSINNNCNSATGSLGMWSGIKPSKQTPQSKAPSVSRDQHRDQKTENTWG